MKKRRILMVAAICAVLMTVLAVFGAAKVKQYLAMSPEHVEFLKQEAEKAVKAGENDEEIASIKAATGGFSDIYDVVIEEEPYREIREVIQNGDFVFELQNLRKGKIVRMRGNGVSPMNEAYEMHEQVEDGLFAVVKITAANGRDLKELNWGSLMIGAVVSGQQPGWSLPCMYNYICDYYEDGAYYLAYDLTNALIFADRDIYLALYDEDEPDYIDGRYKLQSTKDGIVSFAPEYTATQALFKLKLDDSFADGQAQKAFLEQHKGIDRIRNGK